MRPVHLALLGDQVHVLDHDHRRLKSSGDRARLADQVQRVAGELDDGGARRTSEQVPDGVRLADPRRPEEQQTALEVLPGREQSAPVPSDPDHLTRDRGERLRGEDDLVVGQVRTLVEAQHRFTLAEHRPAERDDLAAVHVVHHRQLTDLGRDPGRDLGVVGGHLDHHP